MPFLVALVVLLALLADPAHAARLVTDPHFYKVTAQHRIKLEFPVGELKVVGTDDEQVEFRVTAVCDDDDAEACAKRANRLELESTDRDGVLRLKLENYPKLNRHGMHLEGELRVPRKLAVSVDMGVGELEANDLSGDLDADLGVGQATVRTALATTGRVNAVAGIGQASIHGAGDGEQRSTFIGANSTWNGGPGRSAIKLHVGVGEAAVKLK
ncbi:MAG: hypothetical protein RL760_27 [Candidatus Eisenbacteria bacterium]|jgi:hypothetical protein